jgi:hypothetical protein
MDARRLLTTVSFGSSLAETARLCSLGSAQLQASFLGLAPSL